MGFSFGKPKDTLLVALEWDQLFVHPPPARPAGSAEADLTAPPGTSADPLLNGTVTLALGSARKCRKLRVLLNRITTLHSDDFRYESENITLNELVLDLGNEVLSKGEHTFQWSIIIPSNTAVSERSQFGTVRHLVRAFLDSSLESPAKPVWLVANPSPPGEVPQGTEVVVQDCGAIGPLALRLSSSQLTVASLAFLSFQLLAPPEELDIYSISASIDQRFEVHYTGDLATPPRQRNLLFYHDESLPMPAPTLSADGQLVTPTQVGKGAPPPMAHERRKLRPRPCHTVRPGEPFTYSRIVRVPDDDHVRPTTLEGTETRIRVKHRLVFEVKYRTRASKREMHLEIGADLTVASCCCLSESLHLPTYARLAAVEDRKVKPFHMRCLCAASTSSLVEKEGEKLQAADASRVTRVRLPKVAGARASLSRRSREAGRGAGEGTSSVGVAV